MELSKKDDYNNEMFKKIIEDFFRTFLANIKGIGLKVLEIGLCNPLMRIVFEGVGVIRGNSAVMIQLLIDQVKAVGSPWVGNQDGRNFDGSGTTVPVDTKEIQLEQEKTRQLYTTLAKAAGIGLVVGAGVVFFAPAILSAVGFAAPGVIAGSQAAIMQSAIGNVAAESLFASLQSAGVLGISASTEVLIMVSSTGIALVGGGFIASREGRYGWKKLFFLKPKL